jgi:membrane protein DedA with SNARE-associated domain
MNVKRSLLRLWMVGTVLWFLFLFLLGFTDYNGITLDIIKLRDFTFIFGVPIVFWVFLYVCFWISSGFSSDKKKDAKNE